MPKRVVFFFFFFSCCDGLTLCNVCRQYKPWLSMVTATTQLSCCKPYVVTYKMSRGGTHSCSKGSTLGLQSHMSAGVWHLPQTCPSLGQWMKRPLLAPPCSEVCAPSRLSSAHQLLHHSMYVRCVQAQRMQKSLHCVCLSGCWAPKHQAVVTLYTSCRQLAVSSQMHNGKQCEEVSDTCFPVLQRHLHSPLHLQAQPPHPCPSVKSQCPLKILLIGTSLSHCFSMRRSC